MRPSKLHKAWGDINLFELRAGGLTSFNDDSIFTLSIHRGSSGAAANANPSTLEALVPGYWPPRSGQAMSLVLSDAAAAAITAGTGFAPADVKARWTGRIGAQSFDDRGDGKKYRATQLTGATWLAQIGYSRRVYSFNAGVSLWSILNTSLNPPTIPAGHTRVYGGNDTSAAPTGDLKPKDALSKYGTDIGMRVVETRDGHTDVLSIAALIDRATAAAPKALPIARSQAKAPATWSQPVESNETEFRASYTQPDGTLGWITKGGESSTYAAETEALDWTHIKVQDTTNNQVRNEVYARAARNKPFGYTLPKLTVDLLALMRSGIEYHRRQAANLLALEEGGIIALANDWHASLQGIHFVVGITETITPSSWVIDLDLAPWAHITGGLIPPPQVKPRTWDTAFGTWNDQTTTWNGA